MIIESKFVKLSENRVAQYRRLNLFLLTRKLETRVYQYREYTLDYMPGIPPLIPDTPLPGGIFYTVKEWRHGNELVESAELIDILNIENRRVLDSNVVRLFA